MNWLTMIPSEAFLSGSSGVVQVVAERALSLPDSCPGNMTAKRGNASAIKGVFRLDRLSEILLQRRNTIQYSA